MLEEEDGKAPSLRAIARSRAALDASSELGRLLEDVSHQVDINIP